MGHFTPENLAKAKNTISVYPQARSALIPLCHLAQSQDGYLSEEAMVEIAELVGVSPAEVRGTASFYDMLHTEPVGKHLVSICTNIACMLAGAYELLEHATESLGVHSGQTTSDGEITLEEVECIAACDRAPCVSVNHRFFLDVDPDTFDQLMTDLRSGKHSSEVPSHGTLSRVERSLGLAVPREQVAEERAAADKARAERKAKAEAAGADKK